MKLKILIGILIALIAINLAVIGGYVYFRFIRSGPPNHSWVHNNRDHYRDHDHHHNLDLTPAQRQNLFKLLKNFFNETKIQRDSLHNLEEATFKLLQQDPIPKARIDSNLKQIAQLRIELNQNLIGKLIETKSFLSRDQQKKFYNAIMQIHPERRPPPPPDSLKNPSKQ